MKIQCDMCEKKEAAVYCTADEASLCHGCDRRVHHANKHPRFSLHYSSDEPPCCDICQERRAFLFCKEDRAILCRECDISVHIANEQTQYHCRFLLAGVKLSCYNDSWDDQGANSETESRKSWQVQKLKKSKSVNEDCSGGVRQEEGASISMEGSSSISEYLMETLPGWHVEEFLDPCVPNPYHYYEGNDSGTCTLPLTFMAHDSDKSGDLGTLWSEDLGLGSLVNSSTSSMDHKKSRTSGMSKRFLNESEGLKKNNKKKSTNTSSTMQLSRQLW